MTFKLRLVLTLLIPFAVSAQDYTPNVPQTNAHGSNYKFTIIKDNGALDVRNQNKSGTCWCFSTQSFLESELLRMGKGKIPLSEMFVIHNMYLDKAKNYVRYQGHAQFGEGGEPHDVMNAVRKYGIVPADAYIGLPRGESLPVMGEMDAVLKAMLDEVNKLHDGKLNPNWFTAFQGALDGYMGVVPTEFKYDGKSYTPKTFAKYLGINPEDYVEITSFTHHPFYSKFALEVPDNWAGAQVYNVPLDEFQKITDNAIQNGYTVEWGADVSEPGCAIRNYSLAIIPDMNMDTITAPTKKYIFNNPVPQLKITDSIRQAAFDNLSTTDDHGMQITGMANDQNGTPYYIVKNSWGTSNYCNGYFYVSTQYYLYKTTSIMVNKNAIPEDIRKKMGL